MIPIFIFKNLAKDILKLILFKQKKYDNKIKNDKNYLKLFKEETQRNNKKKHQK